MANQIVNILEDWPSTRDLAADLGLRDPSHCRTMKARGRIPRAYWHDLVEAAERRGIKGISIARLKSLHATVGVRPS